MKKLVYLLIAFGFTFMSCDPVEDINADLAEESAKNDIIGNLVYTFEESDYTDEISDGGYFEFNYPNFGSIDEAKSLIPVYISGEYPVWGVTYDDSGAVLEASSALMTFDWYNRIDTFSADIRVLTDEEHNEVTGNTYGNFDRDYHIFNFIDAEYPAPEEGDFISLRYQYYAGSVTELTDGFLYENEEWTRIKGFTPDEYSAMGESYPNFSSHDEAAAKIPVTLPEIYKFDAKEAGDIVVAAYELYSSGVTTTYTSNFIYDGTEWSKYDNVATETIQFSHDGTTWVPDNTIKYTLTGADYASVGNGTYSNFDVRSGKDEETVEARLAKINTILLNNFPGMEEGQKFSVTYNVYSGSNEVWVMNVILEGGVYVIPE